MADFYENEAKMFGAYVGTLISILTEKNEKEGKKTVINLGDNRLDWLCYCCRKFDIINLGENSGNYVFNSARIGKEINAEKCEGHFFAAHAGRDVGKIEKIYCKTVAGNEFAWGAGSDKGTVGVIEAGTVTGNNFAHFAGSYKGNVGKICAKEVSGDCFALQAAYDPGNIEIIEAGSVTGKCYAQGAESGNIKAGKIFGAGYTPKTIIGD